MFSYDSNTVAEIVFSDYVEIMQKNIDLRAQLNVAMRTVEALKEKLEANNISLTDGASVEEDSSLDVSE